MAGDIFAPPTQQEIAMFAAPTKDELQSSTPEVAPSQFESLLRGGAQGASLGFADELAGAGGAGINALKKGDVSDVVADYIRNRDDYRKADEAARKANPKTFTGGELGGGLATAVIPGLNIGRAATLGGRIAGAAGLGAVAGLGGSNADLTQGDIGGAARDAALGGATGAVLQPTIEKAIAPAVGYVAGKFGDAAGYAGKKALNVAFDTPEAVTERYLANPEAVNGAMTKEGVAQKLADTLGEVRSDTGPAATAAKSSLSDIRQPAQGMELNRAVDILGKFDSPEAKALAEKLQSEYSSRIGGVSPEANAGYLTENEVHEVKKTLQGLGDWKSTLPSGQQAAANQASGELNATLKGANPDYASAMGDLADNIQAKKALAQKFRLTPDRAQDSGFTYTDQTLNALNDLVRGNKVDRARVLESLKTQGYGDLAEDVKNTLANQYFEGQGRTNGSRRVAAMAGIGGAIGHFSGLPGGGFVGAGIGSAAGATIDKFGPQIAKKALDAAVLTQKLSASPSGQKFIQAIQGAAAQGQGALATTHFILSQTQPEYQDATTDN